MATSEDIKMAVDTVRGDRTEGRCLQRPVDISSFRNPPTNGPAQVDVLLDCRASKFDRGHGPEPTSHRAVAQSECRSDPERR